MRSINGGVVITSERINRSESLVGRVDEVLEIVVELIGTHAQILFGCCPIQYDAYVHPSLKGPVLRNVLERLNQCYLIYRRRTLPETYSTQQWQSY
jgi:hypothetical protein